MTLPETTPPPVIGYAGAETIRLDVRALARVRLGNWFLIAYTVSSPAIRIFYFFLPTSTLRIIVSSCVTFALVAAACLLAANTRLPSDRTVFRRLLVAVAIALAIIASVYTVAWCSVFGAPNPGRPPSLRVITTISPFYTIANGTAVCLCFARLADLARRFHARAIATQCLVAAIMFLALYSYYLIPHDFLVAFFGSVSARSLVSVIAVLRPTLFLWAAVLPACLLPRLTPARV